MNWKLLFILAATVLLGTFAQASDDDLDDDVTVETEESEEEEEDIIQYKSPTPNDRFYFAEHFDSAAEYAKKWIRSEAMKEGIDADIAKYDGEWALEVPQRDKLQGDFGLVLKSKAKHAAIASHFLRPFVFNAKPLIVQYEVTLQDGQECGGAYIKLLSEGRGLKELNKFQDKTPYTIMFGPDKCGNDHKLHFIFRHRNPLNGSFEEKHCKKPKERLEEAFKDKMPHLYTLILRPDNTFEVKLDHKVINDGNLFDDFTPSVNPPEEIDDPNDSKPEDWDEREKIPDPEAVKPEDWDESAPAQIPDETAVKPDGWLEDEPELIPDPTAVKPDDWDSEMDGDWEAPLIPNPSCEQAPGCGEWKPPMIANPAYKGKWHPPHIANPNYKGKWKPRRIPNPDFFEDKNPFKMTTIAAVGIELWSMSKDILFDNIIVTDDLEAAEQWAAETYALKRRKIDKDSESFVTRVMRFTHQNPWVWAVYVLVFGLPVVLVLFFCCTSGSSSAEKEEMKRAAEAKKTDSVTQDDPIDEATAAAEEIAADTMERVPAQSKSTLEEEADVDTGDIDNEASVPSQGEEAAGDMPRKRKVRKD